MLTTITPSAHYIENVERGGQAYKAGLRSGERIVEINRLNVEKVKEK